MRICCPVCYRCAAAQAGKDGPARVCQLRVTPRVKEILRFAQNDNPCTGAMAPAGTAPPQRRRRLLAGIAAFDAAEVLVLTWIADRLWPIA